MIGGRRHERELFAVLDAEGELLRRVKTHATARRLVCKLPGATTVRAELHFSDRLGRAHREDLWETYHLPDGTPVAAYDFRTGESADAPRR